jgi:hypothetical protein
MRAAAWCKSLGLGLCLAAVPLAEAVDANAPAIPASAVGAGGCLATGNGFLRARIRGALSLDIDWKNADLECDGTERPHGRGIIVSFAGPKRTGGRRLRMVFGIETGAEGVAGRALPTNLTVILEGERRLFATRGDDHCTVDALQEEKVSSSPPGLRSYRVVARGFCTEPAGGLGRNERILVTRFDFAGRVSYDSAVHHSSTE